ncbi:TPA: isoleucine--tRNA ligase [Candidatus Uhrbacteria bacterium]|nr:isoleucine--tRNA ligase [Candidatus Uhrbacteria bacterium]
MSDMHKTHSEQEIDVLEYWDRNKIFERTVAERPAEKSYTFYDGPPFATGLPHYGHIVGSVMKDVVPRFWTMQGFRVERRWGWDCHGLPIENIVEKKFDLKSKKDIFAYGVDKFNESCESMVMTYAAEWEKVIYRLGRWVDMKNDYKTMDLSYMESTWWVFKSLWDKGLIYEGKKAMHICPRCETALSNFEVAQGYVDVTDISVTVAVELTSGKYVGASILVWTTTPWTLPGNVLLAVKGDMTYVLVKEFILDKGVQAIADQKSTKKQIYHYNKYIVAKPLIDKVFKGKEYTVIEEVMGSELVDASYTPIFSYFENHENAFKVVAADFVTDTDGTGTVHIAPGYGDDDMKLGESLGVKPIMHVGMNGQFVPEVALPLQALGYEVEGKSVKSKGDTMSVDIEIIKALAHAGKLFAKEKLVHSYPHCWRCDTPLLNYATSSWFVRVTEIRDKMVSLNKEINWVPDNMKEGRFGKWLEGARDWAISRSRFWGTPLPVWRAEDGEVLVVGSVAELEALTGKKVDNLHKHIVDLFTIDKGGKMFTRIPEVLDCWFESGSMPYAQEHYPFEHEADFGKKFPAQFIAEGQDQTRGWFYSLHVLATALFEKPAFENVIVNGIVLAEDGKKMAKRLQNYPDPMMVMEKYGADAIRYYLMSTPVVKAENLRFSEAGVDEVSKKFINIMRNVLAFYNLYAEHDAGQEPKGENVLDAWILARLNETLEMETKAMEGYELADAARTLQVFVTDLSTWYIRRSRDRMKVDNDDRRKALATMRVVLDTFAKMVAPFMPFLAEVLYQGVGGNWSDEERPSVHLEMWPQIVANEKIGDVLTTMGLVRSIVSRAMEVRDSAGMAIKQVLGGMTISVPGGEIAQAYVDIITDELNVKKATVRDGELNVELDLVLTPELVREGMAREVTRRVNGLRKEAGLTIADRITLHVWSAAPEVKMMFDEFEENLAADTLASAVRFEQSVLEHAATFRVAELDVTVSF